MAPGYAGTSKQHRKSASFEMRSTRIWAQRARAAARRGNCREALSYLTSAAFNAGRAKAERLWAAKRGKGGYLGHHIAALREAVFKSCGLGRR